MGFFSPEFIPLGFYQLSLPPPQSTLHTPFTNSPLTLYPPLILYYNASFNNKRHITTENGSMRLASNENRKLITLFHPLFYRQNFHSPR